jgi:hypothetical protein
MKIEVEVPSTLVLGRNGAIGTLDVDWTAIPSHVLDHIAKVYFPQYITDAANAGGKDATKAERFAAAQKKLDNMYAGVIRARGEAEYIDPVERIMYRLAKRDLVAQLKKSPQWDLIPKGIKGDERLTWVINKRAEIRHMEPKELDDVISGNMDSYRERAEEIHAQETTESDNEFDV